MNSGVPNMSMEMLASFVLNELPESERAMVEQHLTGSAEARAMVGKLRTMLGVMASAEIHEPPTHVVMSAKNLILQASVGASEPEGWLTQAALWLAKLVFDGREQAVPAGFRSSGGVEGSAAARHLTYDCEGGEVDLELTAVGGGIPGIWRVRGQASVGTGVVQEVACRSTGGKGWSIVKVDGRGRFESQVAGGELLLRVRTSDGVIELPPVRVE